MYGDADSGRGSIETEAHHVHHSQLQRATTLLSPQLIGRPPSASISSRSHHAASESDDSSLNSTDDVVLTRRTGPIPSPVPNSGYSASRADYYEASQFHNVISGSVTTVPIEGQSASAIQVVKVEDLRDGAMTFSRMTQECQSLKESFECSVLTLQANKIM
jgi:hypothetical protein